MFIAPTILTPEGPKELPISFGSAEDAEVLEAWAVDAGHSDTAAAADAVEFAKLGGKRWRYYSRRGETARSLDDLMQRIAAAPKSEIGFLLVARPEQSTPTSTLAMAWCRRTWCNHLILDFLACHPLAFDKRSGYRGAGTAMLVAMGLISTRLGAPLLWGGHRGLRWLLQQERARGQTRAGSLFHQGQALAATAKGWHQVCLLNH